MIYCKSETRKIQFADHIQMNGDKFEIIFAHVKGDKNKFKFLYSLKTNHALWNHERETYSIQSQALPDTK